MCRLPQGLTPCSVRVAARLNRALQSAACAFPDSEPCCRRSKPRPPQPSAPLPSRSPLHVPTIPSRRKDLCLFRGVAFDHRRNRRRKNGCLRQRAQSHRDRRIGRRRQHHLPGARPLRIALRSPHLLLALDLQAQRRRIAQARDVDPFRLFPQKSRLDEKNLKTGETKHIENDLAGCATDVITGFYYLQSLPLQLGERYEFPISDGKTTIVRATVEKREQIRAPAGTFPSVMITAEATSGPLQNKGKVWVWFSEDASHTPVQMRVKLGWGTLLFRLQRIEK